MDSRSAILEEQGLDGVVGAGHVSYSAGRGAAGSSAFCVCRRFSAWSHTTECGPSITSSVISWPRWAGRQCSTMTSGAASVDELLVELVGGEHERALVGLGLLAHARPDVRVQDVGPGRRLDRVVGDLDGAARLRGDLLGAVHHLRDRLEPGRRGDPHGHARDFAPASSSECATLLPSPEVGERAPGQSSPSRSRIVSRSASAWQGCSKSESEFTTGHGGGAREHLQPLLLEGPQHDRVDVAGQHAAGVLDRLAAAQLELGRGAGPPRARRAGATATSNETRVRVDGFSKISATDLPREAVRERATGRP